MPNLADLDQNGTVEIITESFIIDGTTGAIIKAVRQSAAQPSGRRL